MVVETPVRNGGFCWLETIDGSCGETVVNNTVPKHQAFEKGFINDLHNVSGVQSYSLLRMILILAYQWN